jgi:hypothetical protein
MHDRRLPTLRPARGANVGQRLTGPSSRCFATLRRDLFDFLDRSEPADALAAGQNEPTTAPLSRLPGQAPPPNTGLLDSWTLGCLALAPSRLGCAFAACQEQFPAVACRVLWGPGLQVHFLPLPPKETSGIFCPSPSHHPPVSTFKLGHILTHRFPNQTDS